jgi:hypothetical protein
MMNNTEIQLDRFDFGYDSMTLILELDVVTD